MKKLRQIFFRAWRPGLMLLSLGVIAYLLYFHHLGKLLPGYDSRELATYQSAADWHTIVHNPLNAPYKVLLWLIIALGHHAFIATRIVAAFFGTLGALVFFAIIKPWYGYRVAFLTTILFATSAGLLHAARLGTTDVLQVGVLGLMAVILWYRRVPRKRVIFSYILVAGFALLCYIPGLIWFELLGIILLRQGAIRQIQAAHVIHRVIWALLFLLMLTPLALASVHTPSIALHALGLPEHLSVFRHVGSNLFHTLLAIGIRSPGNPESWVGHAPLLDIVELALGIIGGFYYLKHERSVRTEFLAASLILGIVLASLGGPVSFSLLVPLLYLFVACGVNNLLSQWLTVFPRNPIARLTGIFLVVVMLFFSVLYQTRSYFIAWPHNPATRHTFTHPQT